MSFHLLVAVLALSRWDGGAADTIAERLEALLDCAKAATEGFRPIAEDRELRFLGKVAKETGNCRGGQKTLTHLSPRLLTPKRRFLFLC